jgi:hypothetical protein
VHMPVVLEPNVISSPSKEGADPVQLVTVLHLPIKTKKYLHILYYWRLETIPPLQGVIFFLFVFNVLLFILLQ